MGRVVKVGSLVAQQHNDRYDAGESDHFVKSSAPTKHQMQYILPQQKIVHDLYQQDKIQICVAGIIFLNFFIAVINKQLMPAKGSREETVFFVFECQFAVVFFIELIVNMYGSFPIEFWKSGWNWFDFIIVIISLMSLFMENLPGISVLRLFRAFRVFRLFKRVDSLKLIIEGIMHSLSGVANAFMVLFIIMGIWSIMGVEFYGRRPLDFELNPSDSWGIRFDHSGDWKEGWKITEVIEDSQAQNKDIRVGYWLHSLNGTFLNEASSRRIKEILRNPTKCNDPCKISFTHTELRQRFGSFMKSIFSMWQIMSMDSWASNLARGCIFKAKLPLASVYFVSYLFISGIIMSNVVVAILLDKYIEGTEKANALKNANSVPSMANYKIEALTPSQSIRFLQKILDTSELNKLSKTELLEVMKEFSNFPAIGQQLRNVVQNYRLEEMSSRPGPNNNTKIMKINHPMNILNFSPGT